MAFNPTEGRAEYTASAGQTIFTFTFKIFDTSDIKAYLTPAGSDPDDTSDLLTETTDYSIVINGDNGGDLTLVAAASVGDKVTLVRELPVDRTIEFQKSGDFDADVINSDQEYQTYLVQDSKVDLDRTFRIPDTAQGFDTTITTLVSDGYFKVNATGDGVEADTTVPDAVTTSGDYVLDAASWSNEDEDVPVQEFTSGVGADRVPTVYSAKHWAIKAQDAAIGGTQFRDTEWRIFDDLDNTKKIAFQASGITTATTRTITMPDADVDLGAVALKSNVLELDNTTPFTPDADYEPATKKYVDDSSSVVISVTGSATLTNSTNNINLTGIGSSGVEIGDVITVSGSTSNDQDYTIEVITDADNIIVNQAHAGGTSGKSLVDEGPTASVTITLLVKYYDADSSQGRDWVDVAASRSFGVTYYPLAGRAMDVNIVGYSTSESLIAVTMGSGAVIRGTVVPIGKTNHINAKIPQSEASYSSNVAAGTGTVQYWYELR